MSLIHNHKMASSTQVTNLPWNKKKHKSRMVMSAEGEGTPPLSNPNEPAQNLSPLIDRSPSQLPPAIWQKWSPYRGSPNGNSTSLSSVLLHSLVPTCKAPAFPRPPLLFKGHKRRRVTGTLFGLRKGRVTFAVQVGEGEEPGLLLELAFPTCFLVDEMAAGVVRILLECEKVHIGRNGTAKMAGLWDEPVWTMYSNGRQCGFAVSRPYTDEDRHIFSTLGAVSAGAGVLPASSLVSSGADPEVAKIVYGGEDGNNDCAVDVMFMRAKFERVVGKNSEAFYMMNPGGNRGSSGPELSIFLLRV